MDKKINLYKKKTKNKSIDKESIIDKEKKY